MKCALANYISILIASLTIGAHAQDISEAEFEAPKTMREVVDLNSPVVRLNPGDVLSTSQIQKSPATIITKGNGPEKSTIYVEGVRIQQASQLPAPQIRSLNTGLPLLIDQTAYNTATEAVGTSNQRVVRQPVQLYRSTYDISPYQMSASAAQQALEQFTTAGGGTQNSSCDKEKSKPAFTYAASTEGQLPLGTTASREVTRLEAQGNTMGRRECNRLPERGYDPEYTFDRPEAMVARFRQVAASAGLDPCAIEQTAQFISSDFRKITNRRFVKINNYSDDPKTKRGFVLDLKTGRFMREYVAQASGTSHRNLRTFSSRNGSNLTPLGFHVTSDIYYSGSMNRCALRLVQMTGRGSSASDCSERRGVVFHGAEYCRRDTVRRTGYCGGTNGCPGVPEEFFNAWAARLAGGAIVFNYHKGKCPQDLVARR